MRILLIEDNDQNRYLATFLLEKRGHQVVQGCIRLAPGARIRGADNLLQLSGGLVGQTMTVHYTTDIHGLLMDVWVLTAEEKRVNPWPRTPTEAAGWRFDPGAQRWAKP